MKTKIYLCDLSHNFSFSYGTFSERENSRLNTFVVVPLNISSLAAYAHKMLPDELEIELFKYPEQILAKLDEHKPDILGLSNYIWNKDINEKVIRYAKEHYPDLLVVMGGPGIRTDRDGILDFMNTHRKIDIYVMFQGEDPFVQIVKAFRQNGRSLLLKDHQLANCAYLVDNNLVYHENIKTINIREIPSPYLTGLLDDYLKDGLIPLFETNRGCPFQCTFCAWGVSALNKVCKFPIDRVMDEMDYVAKHFPDIPAWVIADANFGIFKRDIQIAKKINKIIKKNTKLKEVRVWDAKNFPDRVVEINQLLGRDKGEILYAVQTLDPVAQKAIKRDNIKIKDISTKVKNSKSKGLKVITHLIAPLPGESFTAQMETLRKCFDLEFDGIYIMAPVILAGTEMETQQSRIEYGLTTKFYTRQYGYGEYRGIKSIECEEVVYKTNAISLKEAQRLKLIHWIIWYGWCYDHLKPLFKCAHKTAGINPADLILEIVDGDDREHQIIKQFFMEFCRCHDEQSFESEQALKDYFFNEGNWHTIVNNEIVRSAHLYNAKMTIGRAIFEDLVALMVKIVNEKNTDTPIDEVANVVTASRFYPEEILSGKITTEKKISITGEVLPFIQSVANMSNPAKDDEVISLDLYKSFEDQQNIISELNGSQNSNTLLNTVECLIRNNSQLFTYHIGSVQFSF